MLKKLGLILLVSCVPALAQTPNCPSGFTTGTGACSVANIFPGGTAGLITGNGGAALSGSTLILQPTGVSHNPSNLNFATAVNDQAFQATYTFIPNGWNLCFYLENVTHNGGQGAQPPYNLAQSFSGGAGNEGACYQAFGSGSPPDNAPPNNIWFMNWDSSNLLANNSSVFGFSNVQIYQQVQSPLIPNDSVFYYYPTNKVSTSPVPLNSPATTRDTTTGDTYTAEVTYTGQNVTAQLFDATAGGSCPGSTCFTFTWQGVSIPSLVANTTAIVGFGGSTNAASTAPLVLDSFVYNVLSPAATPSMSPSSGAFGSTQSVTVSDSSSGSIICWNTTGNPTTNGIGGCVNGTIYTGAISVAKGQTIYAVAGSGSTAYADSSAAVSSYNITGTASQPTYSVAPGTYQGNQTLTLTAAQGSVICFNTTGSPATNGTTGCATGTLYTAPILISSNETVFAVSGGTGLTDSGVGSAAYIINPFTVVDGFTGSSPANSPTFSPLPGIYSGTQNVALASTTSGAQICYLLSATTPTLLPAPNNLGQNGNTFGCSVGTLYTGPVAVSSSQTFYAVAGTVAGAAGSGPPSSSVAGTYVIRTTPTAATPVFSPSPGTYTSTQTVTVTDSTAGSSIFCTQDGSTPTPSSAPYTGPFTVSSTKTIQCMATASGFSNSAVGGGLYTINLPPPVAATPTFSPGAGTYTSSQTVTLTSTTPASTIHYSFNNTLFFIYTSPLLVSTSETVYAFTTASGFTQSATGSAVYVINLPAAATPTFTPAAGTYTTIQSVTLASATGGATITYTTDGSTPTPASTPYTGAISVGATQTIKALATAPGFSNSAVGSALYTINLPTAATPTFSPVAGTYTSTQTVTIGSTTAGASIFYTTDGSTPTPSSTLYTGPITVATSQTVKAIAVLTGFINSAVGSAAYTITSPPPGCMITGTMVFHGTVTLTCPQ